MPLKFSFIKPVSLACAALLFVACSGQDSVQSEAASKPSTTQTLRATQAAAKNLTPLERGEKIYKRKCKSCHTAEEGGRHRVGPNLWAVYGSNAGAKEGFAYSKAMSESGIVWTDETLDGYIENPRKYLPGNRMSYAGLRKPEERQATLAFLKSKTTPAE